MYSIPSASRFFSPLLCRVHDHNERVGYHFSWCQDMESDGENKLINTMSLRYDCHRVRGETEWLGISETGKNSVINRKDYPGMFAFSRRSNTWTPPPPVTAMSRVCNCLMWVDMSSCCREQMLHEKSWTRCKRNLVIISGNRKITGCMFLTRDQEIDAFIIVVQRVFFLFGYPSRWLSCNNPLLTLIIKSSGCLAKIHLNLNFSCYQDLLTLTHKNHPSLIISYAETSQRKINGRL